MREREVTDWEKTISTPWMRPLGSCATGEEFGAMEQIGRVLNIPFLQIQGKFAPIWEIASEEMIFQWEYLAS